MQRCAGCEHGTRRCPARLPAVWRGQRSLGGLRRQEWLPPARTSRFMNRALARSIARQYRDAPLLVSAAGLATPAGSGCIPRTRCVAAACCGEGHVRSRGARRAWARALQQRPGRLPCVWPAWLRMLQRWQRCFAPWAAPGFVLTGCKPPWDARPACHCWSGSCCYPTFGGGLHAQWRALPGSGVHVQWGASLVVSHMPRRVALLRLPALHLVCAMPLFRCALRSVVLVELLPRSTAQALHGSALKRMHCTAEHCWRVVSCRSCGAGGAGSIDERVMATPVRHLKGNQSQSLWGCCSSAGAPM
jgi:hypothetical protein